MKTVLVPLVDTDDTASLLSAAAAVAKDFDSLVEGFCFKVTYPATAYFEAAPAVVDERFEQDYRERAAAFGQRFYDTLKAEGIPKLTGRSQPGKRGARWVDEVEGGYPYVTNRARLFDLVVVAQGGPSPSPAARGVFEAALFETGRPVLVTPRAETRTLGRNVLIAWNGSDESVRAIVFALPFLHGAERVSVLTVEGATVPGPTADEIAGYLAHHGIASEALHVRPESGSAAETILAEAGRLGADLLVKGAYTHSRLRQMIFGGATRHILEHAAIPVLMAH